MIPRVLAFVPVLVACGGAPPPAAREPATPLPTAAAARPGDASVAAQATIRPDPVGPPAGYVEMHAVRVAPLPQGDAVLLADLEEATVLPIFVGGTEALSIQLRLTHAPFERPLTHDLVDSLMRELGGSVAKVQVDELRGSTFIGSIWVRHEGRVVAVDARPSDAIALALGARAPIYVARAVVAAAGLSLATPPDGATPPAGTTPTPAVPPQTY